ncbi:MAG: hypothetical protein FGM16_09285 [Flavobacterium sp.]|nr:hypothetical protein [Flavobacterium sp.]
MAKIKLDGQEYEYGNGVTREQVEKFHAKTYKSQKQPKQEKAGFFETGFPRGVLGQLKKSKAGVKEFVTGKPEEYELTAAPQTFGEIGWENLGSKLAHLGKTASGALAGAKLGKSFGPYGSGIGALIGAGGTQYLTQPGPRAGLERVAAGLSGALETLMVGTGHPERIKLGRQIQEQQQKIPDYALKLLKQEEEAGTAKEFTQFEKEKAIEETGASSIGSLKRKKKIAEEKLAKMPSEQELAIKDKREGMGLLPLLPPEKGMGIGDITKQKAEIAENQLKNIFEPQEGAPTHETNINNLIKNDLAIKQSALGKEYQNFKENHANKTIEEGYVKDANQIISELPDPGMLELFGYGSKSAEELGNEVNKQLIPITKNVNTVFDNWRSLKRYAQRARGKARAMGKDISPDERNALISAADKYDAAAAKLETTLEKNKYGNSLKEIKNLNSRYANEYAPIYDTNAFWYMQKEGAAPPNFLNAIEGNVKGKEILRNTVKNNPELLKSALGQAIGENPKEAFKGAKKTLLNPYIKSHAESKPYFEQLKSAIEKLPTAEKEQADLIKESIRVQNSGNELLKNIKLKKEARIERKELSNVVGKTEEYIARLTRAITNKKEKMRNVQMTKKQQAQAEKELMQLQEQKDKLGVIKNGLGLTAAKYVYGFVQKAPKTINKIIQ